MRAHAIGGGLLEGLAQAMHPQLFANIPDYEMLVKIRPYT